MATPIQRAAARRAARRTAEKYGDEPRRNRTPRPSNPFKNPLNGKMDGFYMPPEYFEDYHRSTGVKPKPKILKRKDRDAFLRGRGFNNRTGTYRT